MEQVTREYVGSGGRKGIRPAMSRDTEGRLDEGGLREYFSSEFANAGLW